MALCRLHRGHILLLGEGDFSFSVAFIQQLQPNVEVTSTCLLSSKQLQETHPSAAENVAFLLSKGVRVLYEVDATKLQENEYFTEEMFKRIIFNFPHVGGKSNIKKNRALLKDFFSSAITKLADGGDICVTFCKGQGGTPADHPVRSWSDSWQSVAAASYQNLVLREVWPFDIKEYPQYKSTGYRGLDKQFFTDDALTYVFCKCLPLPDPVTPPELNKIYVNSEEYLIDSSYLASHGIRCLCSEEGHPVKLILTNVLDTVITVTDLCVKIIELADPVVQLTTDTNQSYKLLKISSSHKQPLPRLVEDPQITHSISPTDNDSRSKNAVPPSCTSPDTDASSLYLRRTLLDSVKDEIEPDTLCCSYGCVYRRRPVVDCCDLPMKNELLMMSCSCEPDEAVIMMKDVIQRTLSMVLGSGHQVVITKDTGNAESWVESHFIVSRLHSIFINGRSSSQSVTVACNQISETGKPSIPDHESIKCSKVSRFVGYVGVTQDCRPAVLLDLDRFCMIKYDLPDTRLLWSNDSAVLNQFTDLMPQDVYHYKPVSLYPPLWRHDVSFWDNQDSQFSEQRLMDIMRDVSSDALKCVRLMNVWTEPSTGKISHCYRQIYQSYNHAISHDFGHKLQNTVRLTLASRLAVELR